MIQRVWRFLTDEGGPTAVEYAALVLLAVLVILTGLTWLGQSSAVRF